MEYFGFIDVLSTVPSKGSAVLLFPASTVKRGCQARLSSPFSSSETNAASTCTPPTYPDPDTPSWPNPGTASVFPPSHPYPGRGPSSLPAPWRHHRLLACLLLPEKGKKRRPRRPLQPRLCSMNELLQQNITAAQ